MSKLEWVCAACGKHGPDRMDVGDVSCFLNAVLCSVTSFVFGEDTDRVVHAEAYVATT